MRRGNTLAEDHGFTRKDGLMGISSCAYVNVVNSTEGITEEAIAKSLMAKVQIFGSRLRLCSEARVPWTAKDGKVAGDRGDLSPEDTRISLPHESYIPWYRRLSCPLVFP